MSGSNPDAMPARPGGDGPWVFPCDFPIKVMGRDVEGFVDAVLDVVLRHAPDFDAGSLTTRASSRGSYLSCTCVVRARSREQLDALYRDLVSHPLVQVVL